MNVVGFIVSFVAIFLALTWGDGDMLHKVIVAGAISFACLVAYLNGALLGD